MRLIAKKPCSFGGKKFFIGEEIPVCLVTNPEVQEKLGILAVGKDEGGEAPAVAAGVFTQKQVDSMIADAVERWKETKAGIGEAAIISVYGESGGERLEVAATVEEIQQVFSIMQLNVDEGIKSIFNVTSENVLILLHAADSRKRMKEAAKKQAGNLFPMEEAKMGGADA